MKNLMKVVKCGEMFTVKSEKAEGGVLNWHRVFSIPGRWFGQH